MYNIFYNNKKNVLNCKFRSFTRRENEKKKNSLVNPCQLKSSAANANSTHTWAEESTDTLALHAHAHTQTHTRPLECYSLPSLGDT